MTTMKRIGLSILALTSLSSLIRCPYSKVEESFNLQATHDLYYYGLSPAMHSMKEKYILSVERGDSTTSTSVDHPTKKEGEGSSKAVVYDHLQYPGVVPRTFLGPFVISLLLQLITVLVSPFCTLSNHPYLIQTLSRGILMSLNIHAHYRLANAISIKLASSRANARSITKSNTDLLGGYFLLITASQFHIPYYQSRMLPNSFALIFITHAYTQWFLSKPNQALILIVATTAIFRCDMLILLFTIGLTVLLQRKLSILQALRIGIVTGCVCLIITVPLDSMLWSKLVWPEGEVLFFNTVENKSSEYGISPWYWYFCKAIPKGMLGTILLLPFSLVRISNINGSWSTRNNNADAGSVASRSRLYTKLDLEWISFYLPVFAFVGLYSLLPHKEIRFIFVAFPMLNVMTAKGLLSMHEIALESWITLRQLNVMKGGNGTIRKPSENDFIYKDKKVSRCPLILTIMIYVGGLCTIIITMVGSFIFISVSKENYPGGHAMNTLMEKMEVNNMKKITKVYVDVASAMTGVSLFGQRALRQRHPHIRVVKGGYEIDNSIASTSSNVNALVKDQFDYILSESLDVDGYELMDAIQGHPRLNLSQMRVDTSDAIYVLQRIQ